MRPQWPVKCMLAGEDSVHNRHTARQALTLNDEWFGSETVQFIGKHCGNLN